MSWTQTIKELGPQAVLFLSTDGASVNGIIVGDPIVMESSYRNKPQTRIAAPMVTTDGFYLLIIGKRTARKLATLEASFSDHVINITRHGAEGDSDTSYEVNAIADANAFKALQKIKAKAFTDEALSDAIADAREALKSN